MSLILHPRTAKELQSIAGKPPHALLIVAPAGAGKHAVALRLASQLLNAEEAKLENNAALMVVVPDKDQVFGIDSVRGVQHYMTLKTQKNKNGDIARIALLPDAHRMTREAQNALLKLLEEPPEGSMLLLTATNEQSLLPTIVSRCQVLTLRKPSTEQLTTELKKSNASVADIQLALKISDGWPALALAMVDAQTEHPLAAAANYARTLLQQPTFERLTQVDSLAKNRELCVDICYILQQMAHIALQTAKQGTVDHWQRVLTASYACQEALQSRVNAKLAMTQLMLSL